MKNLTKENIKRKRRIRKRRRRLKIFRLLFFLLLLGLFGSVMAWGGWHLYLWGNRIYQAYDTMYQGYEDRQQVKHSQLNPRFDAYTNVLILGLDDGKDPAAGREADTLLLMSIDHLSGAVRFVSIPRDTIVTPPGKDQPVRMRQTYAQGGAVLSEQAVSQLLGVSIHQYITLDIEALKEIVDALDGIDVYVENPMDYEDPAAKLSIHLQKGYQHMDGETVQKYLRYRGGELGDVGRVQRQQHFIKVLYGRLLQVDTLPKLPVLIDIFKRHMTTSAEIPDVAKLAQALKTLSVKPPVVFMLPGAVSPADAKIWIPSQPEIDAKMKVLFPPQGETP